MSLLDAYADSTETALNVMAARPVDPEPVKPKHSAWSAIPRAVASAATEIGGNIIDTAAAYGQVAAAAGGLTPGFDPDQTKNRAASVEAMDKLKSDGIDWRTEESQTQYAFSRDLRPDPMTAGTAENLVFGLTRGLTKAVGAAATLGPIGGAAAFGTSEGMTDADALAAQGVDLATRTKVGAVSAAMNAAGVALPVAGKTLAQTAGLVAVGGPLSFMTQQQATRSILEAADYHDIAKQYDPLDPVGLTVATLVPAGFAAAARAGARGGAKAPHIVPTRDDIDAAMVHNLTTLRDVHQETPPVIVYHGSPNAKEFAELRPSSGGELGPGVYFTKDKKLAEDYSVPRGEVQNMAEALRKAGVIDLDIGALNIKDVTRKEFLALRAKMLDDVSAEAGGEWDSSMFNSAMSRVIDSYKSEGFDGIYDTVEKQGVIFPEKSGAIRRIQDYAQKTETNTAPNTDQTPDAYRARVEALTKEQPDLIARLDDAGQPVRLADELAAVRKAAQEGTDTEFGALDAPLLKVAAECALATGTAAL